MFCQEASNKKKMKENSQIYLNFLMDIPEK